VNVCGSKKPSKGCTTCKSKDIDDDEFLDREGTEVEVYDEEKESWVETTIESFTDRKSCTVRLGNKDRIIDLPDNNKFKIRVREADKVLYKCSQAEQIRKMIAKLVKVQRADGQWYDAEITGETHDGYEVCYNDNDINRNADLKDKTEEVAKVNVKSVPTIYACDFNSNPGTKSYRTLIKAAEDAPPQFARAYEEFEGFRTPDYSNGKSLRARGSGYKYSSAKWRKGGEQKDKLCKTIQTIDFIFYTTGAQDKQKHWKCHAVLDLPTLEELEKTSPLLLNDWHWGSDHFCVGADVELRAA